MPPNVADNNGKKKIQINEDFFKLSKQKRGRPSRSNNVTLKRAKKTKPLQNTTIRRELIKRINEHKQHEKLNISNNYADLDPKKRQLSSTRGGSRSRSRSSSPDPSMATSSPTPSNEFTASVQYLNSLLNDNSRTKYGGKNLYHKKSIKNNNTRNNSNGGSKTYDYNVGVGVELPEELQEITQTPTLVGAGPAMDLNFDSPLQGPRASSVNSGPEPPYSNLKGSGAKPTYRQWVHNTRKNRGNIVSGKNSIYEKIEEDRIRKEGEKREKAERRERKEKRKKEESEREEKLRTLQKRIKTANDSLAKNNDTHAMQKNGGGSRSGSGKKDRMVDVFKVKELKHREKKAGKKKGRRVLKKTVKQKYTVGKDGKKKTVSVLVKNMHTRKKIQDAKKELKKTSIPEIKKYLKEQGFLKSGSVAPMNVLREMYESLRMSGDVKNVNKDMQLHNYLDPLS